jgi:hypothetical protein
MQKYLAEKDVLKTFQDAGEHSETAVLGVLHKSGIAKATRWHKAPKKTLTWRKWRTTRIARRDSPRIPAAEAQRATAFQPRRRAAVSPA